MTGIRVSGGGLEPFGEFGEVRVEGVVDVFMGEATCVGERRFRSSVWTW